MGKMKKMKEGKEAKKRREWRGRKKKDYCSAFESSSEFRSSSVALQPEEKEDWSNSLSEALTDRRA